jgi:DNA-binding response OmpR family regulator
LKNYEILKNYSILIVEDDVTALESLATLLGRYFDHVYTAHNGYDGYDLIVSHKIDLILTDMRMPHQDGADFIKRLREAELPIPVIFMSAHTDPKTLLRVIPLQIVDYLVKPIKIEEVLALCETVLKKQSLALAEFHLTKFNYRFPNKTEINLKSKTLTREGREISLTKKELELLTLLIKSRHSVLSKVQIEYFLWDGESVSESSVKTLMKKLRSKIGEDSIETISNMGYKIRIAHES